MTAAERIPGREPAGRTPSPKDLAPPAFHVTRAINNNVVLAREVGADEERVLMGRGVGFRAAAGTPVDMGRVTQVFRPTGGPNLRRVLDVVADLPSRDLEIAIVIADAAGRRFGEDVAQRVLLPLADHLSHALQRFRTGTGIEYPLQWEVASLYPDEVAFAREALGTVERMSGVRLPDVEAVPTALHLVNAQFGRPDIGRTMQHTQLMGEIVRAVETHLARPLQPESLVTSRFVSHLRYLLARGEQARVLSDGMGAMLATMRTTYPRELSCAADVKTIIERHLDTTLGDDELVYITLHIVRLTA